MVNQPRPSSCGVTGCPGQRMQPRHDANRSPLDALSLDPYVHRTRQSKKAAGPDSPAEMRNRRFTPLLSRLLYEFRNEAGPAGLVTGADAGPIVAVKILIK